MEKHKVIYPIILTGLLLFCFLIRNPTHPRSLNAFPHPLATLPIPLVLAVQVVRAIRRDAHVRFGDLFQLTEQTVVDAAVPFGLATALYSYFYFYNRQPGAGPALIFLLITIIATCLIGTLWSLLLAFVGQLIAGKRQTV